MPAQRLSSRYVFVDEAKVNGSTYTPPDLADYLAEQVVSVAGVGPSEDSLTVLDPAVGEGELLASLLRRLPANRAVEVYGFDQDERALRVASDRLAGLHARAKLHLDQRDFLEYALDFGSTPSASLFSPETGPAFDLVIANPPYVRTQILGAKQANQLAAHFGLTGRVDLYHAFVLGIISVLHPHGAAGIILSNRFMTTKAGADVRRFTRTRLNLRHVWDLGDTKLFGAAVLPALIVAEGKNSRPASKPLFSTIYETTEPPEGDAASVIAALGTSGVVRVPDGRRFKVQHGSLDTSGAGDAVWKIATDRTEAWLATVAAHTWGTFRDIGKVRVGVKTCADKVYIRDDWETMSAAERPELLRPLTTHHIGRRFRADPSLGQRQIVYPHERAAGKRRPIPLDKFPKTKAYLERHRGALEARTYVLEAGRQWYEVWVPQDPDAWPHTKLIFRDISEEPCFWIDKDGTVVNGDCYWLIPEGKTTEELLWLAVSVGNSKFIESFYDHCFNNKLYAGRRRFITQYVEKFPLPNPKADVSRQIVELAKAVYKTPEGPKADEATRTINRLVHVAFGLGFEEVAR